MTTTYENRAKVEAAYGDALVFLAEIHAALARGTRHYDLAGNELRDERAICEALLRDDKIVFEPRKEG